MPQVKPCSDQGYKISVLSCGSGKKWEIYYDADKTHDEIMSDKMIKSAIALTVDGMVSNCCGATVYNGDICIRYKKHCEPVAESETIN